MDNNPFVDLQTVEPAREPYGKHFLIAVGLVLLAAAVGAAILFVAITTPVGEERAKGVRNPAAAAHVLGHDHLRHLPAENSYRGLR